MFLYDTNIFLEILLDQPGAAACQKMLARMSRTEQGLITGFSLHAIEAIMGAHQKSRRALKPFLEFVKEHPYLSSYHTTIEEEVEISGECEKTGLDFDDGLQYYVARKQGAALVTLDRHFRRIKDIPVIFPGDEN